ncbi:N-acetylglucosamine-6-phosphate deacetylase, partial [Bifidobacteriaceae bacterium NR003]
MSKNAYLDAVNKIDDSLKSNEGRSFVVRNVSVVDARGIVPNAWILVKDGVILETGILDEDLALAINACGLRASDLNVVDGGGYFAAPGYIDLHAHGAWEHSFD